MGLISGSSYLQWAVNTSSPAFTAGETHQMITRKERHILECARMQLQAGNENKAAKYYAYAARLASHERRKIDRIKSHVESVMPGCVVTVLW